MKAIKTVLFFVLALSAGSVVRAQDSLPDASATPVAAIPAPPADPASLWDEANTAYINSDFSTAIQLYDSIRSTGRTSAKLYYNMGNAWFKEGNIGRSILCYNRALALSPGDGDIRYNLTVAAGYVKDRIEPVPEFFLAGWVRSLRQALSVDAWAVISLVLFACLLASVLVYLVSANLTLRKAGFYTALCSLALAVLAFGFAQSERRAIVDNPDAVVMATAVAVKSSPGEGGKDLFVLHEGTMLRVLDSFGKWREVVIADGNRGWVDVAGIEMVMQ